MYCDFETFILCLELYLVFYIEFEKKKLKLLTCKISLSIGKNISRTQSFSKLVRYSLTFLLVQPLFFFENDI